MTHPTRSKSTKYPHAVGPLAVPLAFTAPSLPPFQTVLDSIFREFLCDAELPVTQ